MKRFWQEVTVDGGEVRLDGKPIRTPGRAPLVLPYSRLAEAIAENHKPDERESAYQARERLRSERSRLVGDLARRTSRSHREIQARINRETRVKSVAGATIDQLERGNELLRRELWG